jgi:hypothetical protein
VGDFGWDVGPEVLPCVENTGEADSATLTFTNVEHPAAASQVTKTHGNDGVRVTANCLNKGLCSGWNDLGEVATSCGERLYLGERHSEDLGNAVTGDP